MDNTIPFNPTSCTVRTEQITVDVSILSVLNHAASPGRHKPDANIYLAAIAPDMELTIIMEEDAPHILPCFDEEDATITIKGAPLFISYNPAQVLTLAGNRIHVQQLLLTLFVCKPHNTQRLLLYHEPSNSSIDPYAKKELDFS